MISTRQSTLYRVLVAGGLPVRAGSSDPFPLGKAPDGRGPTPSDPSAGFSAAVLTDAGFAVSTAADAGAVLAELKLAVQGDQRFSVLFVDTGVFPSLSRPEISRLIHSIEPAVEIAFLVGEEPADPTAEQPSLARPLSAGDVVEAALVLAHRWRMRNFPVEFVAPAPAAEREKRPAPERPVPRLRSGFRILPLFQVLAFLCIIPLVIGWRAGRGEPQIYTGTVLTAAQLRAQVPWAILGKDRYAQVNSEWLTWYYDEFRTELAGGRYGIVKWDQKFSCTSFASRYASSAQLRYFAQSFYADIPAGNIAVGEFWYRPHNSTEGHALVAAYTERGLVYMDPQNGHFVDLTRTELQSAYLRKFD
jgi:hypothetical protein